MSIGEYLAKVERALREGNATEHTHRPALKELLESLKPGITATNEPRRVECGAPDYVVSQGTGPAAQTVGYVEAKDAGADLGKIQNSAQLKRYLEYLPNLLLTDYLEFRWFVEGEERERGRLARTEPGGGLRRDKDGAKQVKQLVENFLDHAPAAIAKPQDLAVRMAKLAHMIRDIVVRSFEKNKATPLIVDLRKAMAQALIPDLENEDKTPQFADLYAQTLTYGLFAARCNHRGRANTFTRQGAAAEIPRTNPFLRQLFTTITGPDLESEPYADFVEDLVGVLAHSDLGQILEDFGSADFEKDPVLHFYETFLASYDRKLRESRGVYYTPEPVVQYIVRSVDHLLRTRFDIAEGLADAEKTSYTHQGERGEETRESHRTLILDPAAGTGTFLYAAVSHIRSRFEQTNRAGMWSGYVRDHLLPRILGFELLMAPYAVAHFKLGMQLAALDLPEDRRDQWAYDFSSEERLGVYLTNTLESVERHIQQILGPYRIISAEATAASRVKRDLPILVVLGNPPYSGISSNQGEWINNLLKGVLPTGHTASYYEVDGKPLGEKKVWLQDDYVKFIRWAQWRIDRTGQGILAFITNHGYLDNPTFRGMRQALMRSFDEIYILDLHGNVKKRELSPDGSKDENVFDIQQGVAIGLFVKSPVSATGGGSSVQHADLWGSREEKYDYLLGNAVDSTKWTELEPAKPFYLFCPFASEGSEEYNAWPRITELMPVNVTGVVTARDHFVIDFNRDALLERVREFRNETISNDTIREKYFAGKGSSKYADGDTRSWKLPKAREKVRGDNTWEERIEPILYRPCDERFIYYVPWMVDWPRTEAMPHMTAGDNIGLITSRLTKGETFKHVQATRGLVEVICMSPKTSNNGFLFPLYLYFYCPKPRSGA